MNDMQQEMREELLTHIVPFWLSLKDEENGGFYGYKGFDLTLDPMAVKGCILNSRILWFFSEVSRLCGRQDCLEAAEHAFRFMQAHFVDSECGGVYWSVRYDGQPEDDSKHTYNQAFAIYGLSAYYRVSKNEEALELALRLFDVIEGRMRDEGGYLEAFDRQFRPVSNEKLSENGVLAERTMNTLLHVMEAYTELYRVSGKPEVKACLEEMLSIMLEKIFIPSKGRLGVFFDHDYNSLIDLYSYGHDIEAAWLTDRAAEVLGDPGWTERVSVMTKVLEDSVYAEAYMAGNALENSIYGEAYVAGKEPATAQTHSLPAECENGVVLPTRVWWVQAEAVNGFYKAWQKRPEKTEFLEAARAVWSFIKEYQIDRREGSEWFNELAPDGTPDPAMPIANPWKCPYHNGRMCMEV